jgi:uncharacterized protein YabE (DUF348 family)
MRKKILFFSMMTLLAVPVLAVPMYLERGVAELIDEQVTLTVEGNVVFVSGAQGEVLEVVSLTGRQVAQYRIDSASQRVELNLAKGCYVLKVGKVVRKVSIRLLSY